MNLVELSTIAAIIVGPILAVLITRWRDARAQKLERKVSIFRALMKTRRTTLDSEHVFALNLVELEFYRKEKIVNAYRAYIDFRHEPVPLEITEDQGHYNKRGENLLFDLLHEIGCELGYSFDKDDLKRFSYSPKGWHDDQYQAQKNASLLTALLEGKTALPVTAMPPKQDNAYPPPPTELNNSND